jgi:plastocyanin
MTRATVLLVASLSLAAPAGSSLATSAASHPLTVRLQASDFRFCAATAPACTPTDSGLTTVKVGTRVEWTYTDHACDVLVPCPGHNVVFRGRVGGRRTLVKTEGAVIWRTTFTRPGTFSYVCTAHSGFGMTGRVVVTR